MDWLPLTPNEGTVIQIGLWIVAVVLSSLLGPARWATCKAHIDALQEEVDDLNRIVARLREERTTAEAERDTLSAQLETHIKGRHSPPRDTTRSADAHRVEGAKGEEV